MPVCATFDGPAGRRQVITSTLALVPAEGRLNAAWDWAPPESGSWKVGVVAGCSDAAGDSSEDDLLAALPLRYSRIPHRQFTGSLRSAGAFHI